MKLKSKLFTASLLASALFAGLGFAPVMAQNTYTPGIDQAHQTISARIQQGIATGNITQPEAQALYQRGREIEMRENRFKADGNASQQERQQLRFDLEGLNSEVERLMANRDVVRPPAAGGVAANVDNTPAIDKLQDEIGDRIDEGVRTRRISQRDARRFHRREREIERQEDGFKSDGVLTQQERQQLRNELSTLRDDVERMVRNGRVRG